MTTSGLHWRERMPASPNSNGWSAANRWISIFSASLARIGAAGSARQTRIRIVELIQAMVIQAMTSEATDSNVDVQRLCSLAGLNYGDSAQNSHGELSALSP
jgi:hypothetical protein